MRALLAPVREMEQYDKMQTTLARHAGALAVTGCSESQKLNMVYAFGEGYRSRLIITYSDQRCRDMYEDYLFYDKNTYIFPAKDMIFYEADVSGNQIERQRLKVLRCLIENRPVTMITTWSALMMPCVSPDIIRDNVVHLSVRDSLDLKQISKQLVKLGYSKRDMVENPGEFSVHGGILDVYDITEDNPFRIELWGDDIDSIRSFDVGSQRSIIKTDKVSIYPATEIILDDKQLHDGLDLIVKEAKEYSEALRSEFKTEEGARVRKRAEELKEQLIELGMSRDAVNLESYIGYFYKNNETASILSFFDAKKSIVFMDEPVHCAEHAHATEEEFIQSMAHRLEKGYILPGQADLIIRSEVTAADLADRDVVMLASITCTNPLVKPGEAYDANSKSISSYNNSFDALVKDLHKYRKEKYRVLLVSGSRTRARRLAEDLRSEGLTALYTEDASRPVAPGEVECFYGHIRKGFEYPSAHFTVISESDIFGADHKRKRKKSNIDPSKAVRDFAELKVGDYVVHETHGLGVYKGIEQVSVDNVVKDYIKIAYRDGGNLYVPATGLDVIQKYASGTAKAPKLNKLGTKEWAKTTAKVREAVDVVADDLVALYAARQSLHGFKYGPDTIWQKEFEEMFPYEETEDQIRAIEETKSDMESDKIMDRLICGDVGFGKTEIAIRAAFKAIQEGKQVVYLVPTTILAQQHFNTFASRMKDFPVTVELLSRFKTASEQKKTIAGLKNGTVDVVIGTHRVLSKDVGFKNLGLLIVDEEQRFGVTHKETIKKLKETVDVLTLTATPIPRTMHMSLIGIRDMSILEEPPEERRPIQTFVCEYNEELVREAIVREVSRGGQVYYVYNVVANIADVTAFIQKLVPEARVEFAHGQMHEQELERIMYDFVNGDIDVLVSTTIIETGMDIPNVNTMIVHDSDKLGLAQLYQLRGRVGRSNRTSYAFLMYRRDKMLKEVAEKRLEAIREFTDFGSGYRIAMKDLEIRGAGNLLGSRQSGHMQSVGYDMYCKLLAEAVRVRKGEEVAPDFETQIDLDIDAYIPDDYIMNEMQKLDIYKRIASISDQSEYKEMQDELIDRFGAVPECADNLLRIALLKAAAKKLGIDEIKGGAGRIRVLMRTDAPIRVENIPVVLAAGKGRLSFSAKGTPEFNYRYDTEELVELEERNLLMQCEKLIKEDFAPLVGT
ncbi:MAG: transcription-repair coupling factor [Lachnospiraceae bacterium]|nr:transcription-repair coupling factor [Lachnospiraceae bacterium]